MGFPIYASATANAQIFKALCPFAGGGKIVYIFRKLNVVIAFFIRIRRKSSADFRHTQGFWQEYAKYMEKNHLGTAKTR